MRVEIDNESIGLMAENAGEGFSLGGLSAILDSKGIVHETDSNNHNEEMWLLVHLANIGPAKKDTTDGS